TAQEPTPYAGGGESRGRLLGAKTAEARLLRLVLGVRAGPHDHDDLAARGSGREALGQLAEGPPHRLLVELRELAADAGRTRLAPGRVAADGGARGPRAARPGAPPPGVPLGRRGVAAEPGRPGPAARRRDLPARVGARLPRLADLRPGVVRERPHRVADTLRD